MKASLSSGVRRVGSAACWMAVGCEINILAERWDIMRGDKPRPWKVDVSTGALDGFDGRGVMLAGLAMTGLEVKRDDMILVLVGLVMSEGNSLWIRARFGSGVGSELFSGWESSLSWSGTFLFNTLLAAFFALSLENVSIISFIIETRIP